MNAFVTGGTGFIGSHLADHLMDHPDFDEVRCLVRNREKWLENKPYTKVSGDLHSIRTIEDALSGTDIVFHLAGLVKAPTQQEFDHANVDATENLIRLANKAGIKKMVILSSLAATGPSFGRPVSEHDPLQPVSMYGISKKRMEEMIHRVAPKEMSVTILRPPAVYGPREDQIYTLFKMMNYGIAPIVGDGNHPELSIVYVEDVIRGIMKAAGQTTPGVHTYFVSGEEIANWNRIRDIVTTVLGKKNIALRLNSTLVKKIAGAIETTASFFGTYPVINREKANEMILEWTCSTQKASDEIGYTPEVSLEEGISRTLRWYKQHKWL